MRLWGFRWGRLCRTVILSSIHGMAQSEGLESLGKVQGTAVGQTIRALVVQGWQVNVLLWVCSSTYRDTGEFPPDTRKEKLLYRGASERLLPTETWRGPVTEPAGLPATCSGCLGFCHEGQSCPAPLSLCKANTLLGETSYKYENKVKGMGCC